MLKSLTHRLLPLGAIALMAATACSKSDEKTTWEEYTDWRELNADWVEQMENETDENGKKIYTRVVPAWNKNAYVLMRWYNDTTLTEGNLRPLYTSTVDVKYIGRLYNDQPFDSSYTSLTPADSVVRFRLNNLVGGWIIAMERMHVGDSAEVIVPWEQGYGATTTNSKIPPYSALKFDIKLVDIAGEYIRP